MKKILFFITVLFLSACSQTHNSEQGTPFDETKVKQIVEGSTTEAQLLRLLGEPASKTVVNGSDAKWVYTYTKKASTSHTLIGETSYTIEERTLDVIVSNGVVMNYNYSENNKKKQW